MSEALALAKNNDLPLVDENESFWAENELILDGSFYAYTVTDSSTSATLIPQNNLAETVCVMTPTN